MTTTATTFDNVVFIAQPKSSVDLRRVAGHGIELVNGLAHELSLRAVILADLESHEPFHSGSLGPKLGAAV